MVTKNEIIFEKAKPTLNYIYLLGNWEDQLKLDKRKLQAVNIS
jgi:hypothetical protein